MQEISVQDVETRQRMSLAGVVLWLSVFAIFAALLLGNVRLYELKEENRQLAEQLEEYQSEIEDLRAKTAGEPDLRTQAEAMGLGEPDPAAVKILHIRGT